MPSISVSVVHQDMTVKPLKDGSIGFAIVFKDGDIVFRSLGWRLKHGRVLPPEVQLKSGRMFPTGSLSAAAEALVKQELAGYDLE